MDFDNTTLKKDIKDLKKSLEDNKPKEPDMTNVSPEWVEDIDSENLDEHDVEVMYEEGYFDKDGNPVDADGEPLTAFPYKEYTPEGDEILD